jgi:type I restriction enzyme M protein
VATTPTSARPGFSSSTTTGRPKYWKVDHTKLAPNYAEIKDIPHCGASDKEIKEILASLRTFREDEFADLLHQCHNVIRNHEHLDPAAAFDEIAKILFVKTWSERRMRERGEKKNLFTTDVLKQQLSKDPINSLFDQTKESYKTDKIFDPDERINLRPATVEEIVKRLQAYNLSDTSEDVKGIAFERFLGRTFRAILIARRESAKLRVSGNWQIDVSMAPSQMTAWPAPAR